MNNYLPTLIVDWARERGILEKGTVASQYEKHVEEVGELGRALIENDQEKFADAVGDVMVTLIILAAMKNTTIEDCLRGAYQTISGRAGAMVDGVFVKSK